MEDANWTIIIPAIGILPLQDIHYVDIASKALRPNAGKEMDQHTMRRLWTAVVTEIYYSECEFEKSQRLAEVDQQAVKYTKEYFEGIKADIMEYMKRFLNNNRLPGRVIDDRNIVEFYSTMEIRGLYDDDDPEQHRLLSQVSYLSKLCDLWSNELADHTQSDQLPSFLAVLGTD